MFITRDEMDVMCCKSVGTDLSMVDIDDLMTEISQLKKEVALLESKLRERDGLNTKDVSGVSLCDFTGQTSTELVVSICNEDQKTSVNLVDCGIEVKQEDIEADEGDLIYSDQEVVKEEISQLNEIEEKPQHLIGKEESLSGSSTGRNLSPKRSNNQNAKSMHVFICPQCGKTFIKKYKLNENMKTHTRREPYTCDQCGKTDLNKHMKNHTGEKPYRCDQCGKCFICKPHLNWHMRIHTGEKPYRCDLCEKNFIRKSDLNWHMIIHTGEKHYRCDQCEKSFIRKAHLEGHMRIHSGERPYICDQCGKRFNQKSHLNRHISIHTGEKPYSCDQCEKRFNRKCDLKKHMRIHTREML